MEVNEVEKEGNRVEISLAVNGSTIFTDVLVTAVGVKARTSLAEAAGIKTNIGGLGLHGI
jgi:NAD(P)H-nitrite reductase large subunit